MHLLAQSFGFDDVTVDTVEMVKEHNKTLPNEEGNIIFQGLQNARYFDV